MAPDSITGSSSPQKRSQDSDLLENENKRLKIEDFNIEEIDEISSNNNNNKLSSLPLQVPSSSLGLELPLQLPDSIPSSQSDIQSSSLQVPSSQLPSSQLPVQIQVPQPVPVQIQATSSQNFQSRDEVDDDELDDNQEPELTKPTAPADPDKLSDALLSAGVDLKAEEALLNSTNVQQQHHQQPSQQSLQQSLQQQQPIIINTPFLDPRQLSTFMNKIISSNGIRQSLSLESPSSQQILQLMTYSCEDWLKNIISNAIIISRHRRRSIRNNKRRSEISKALRDISINAKIQEDKRIEKKKNFGLNNDEKSKEGSDENLHKATNATVAMMTGGKKKKKYSWMTGGSGNGGGGGSGGSGVNGGGSNSGSKNINDQTIRFREAREESGVVVRDLLSSLEKKRIGVEKTLVKGYSKLKD